MGGSELVAGRGNMAQASANNREIDAKLTEAYLLRIRHQFEESIEKCKEALILSPDDPSAHILIGDIYTEQGRAKDAALWYQMALDLDPLSTSVRSKLDRVETLLRAQDTRLHHPDSPDPDSAYTGIDRFLRGDGFNTLKNIIFLVLVGLFLIAVVGAIVNKFSVRTPTRSVSEDTGGFSGASPEGATPRPRQLGTPVGSANSASSSTASPSPFVGSANSVMGPTKLEMAFATRLQNDQDVAGEKVTIRGVLADPRDQRMTITFHTAANAGKKVILQQALVVAYGALRSAPDVEELTLRADAELQTTAGSNVTQIAFVGDISRKAVQMHKPQDNPLSNPEEMFENVYWHNSFGPKSSPQPQSEQKPTKASLPTSGLPASPSPPPSVPAPTR